MLKTEFDTFADDSGVPRDRRTNKVWSQFQQTIIVKLCSEPLFRKFNSVSGDTRESDFKGVAIRAGHHCCQPLMARLGVAATNRASFYLYSLPEEVDRLVEGVHKARKLFA